LVRSYTVRHGNTYITYYDADAYDVTREFDLMIDDLTVEASKDKLDQNVDKNTNNVINAIMPFDTENCVGWNPSYLRGFTSEKRDTNINALKPIMHAQVSDVGRYRVKESMTYYGRGTKWTKEDITVKGTNWKAAYLPVWLYSYLQDDGGKKLLHYVAVNARTGETMGSVPINKTRLMIISGVIEVIGIFLGVNWIRALLSMDLDEDSGMAIMLGLLGFTPGFIFYYVKLNRYRNLNARHKHEAETKSKIKNLKKTDALREHRKGLGNSELIGRNDNQLKGVVARHGKNLMSEKVVNFLGVNKMIERDKKKTTEKK